MGTVLKTYMSPIFFRTPANPQPGDPESLRPLPDQQGNPWCLLDDLLDGGINLPTQVVHSRLNGLPHSGLFVLLAGPPGSGKSLFALELAYRLSLNANPGVARGSEKGITTFYLSAESESANVIENAQKLGWENAQEQIVPYCSPELSSGRPMPRVILYGRENAQARDFPDSRGYFEKASADWKTLSKATPPDFGPEVLVVDSLNVLPGDKHEILKSLVHLCLRNVLLMIAVLDSTRTPGGELTPFTYKNTHDYWEFFADLVIAFTNRFEKEYLVRKLQVVKARFQDHADGEQRIKINAAPKAVGRVPESGQISQKGVIQTETPSAPAIPVLHPMSPFIREGGIFVFPSVHRYLSRTRRPLPPTGSLPTPFEALNSAIEGNGFPTSRCTALIGSRGSMKSHLAYYTMLKFLKSDHEGKRALLISLRDDENAAVTTLAQIWANQRDDKGQLLDPTLDSVKPADRLARSEEEVRHLLTQDKLEILYFWPGYISPEEFCHLVVVSADRRPKKDASVGIAVINGLEQLEARFPLCAREDMFVSGLITLLTVKGITTVVASGGHSAPGTVPAGLLPMADLILEASFRMIPSKAVNSLLGLSETKSGAEEAPHVVYEVIRGPGAREMRTRLLFYMGRERDALSKVVWPGSVRVIHLPEHVDVGKEA